MGTYKRLCIGPESGISDKKEGLESKILWIRIKNGIHSDNS